MKDSALKASVVILTKNPGAIFQDVLAAVLTQRADFAFDVLVVDSGSTDGTVAYVERVADPRLRLLCIPSHEFGHGKTRNIGMMRTSGEFVAMITHDALPVDQDWLQSLVSLAESDARIAGVFGRHIAYPDATPFTKRDLRMHFEHFGREPVVWMDDKERYVRDMQYRQYLHFFSDNNALLRRAAWQQIPYPEVDFAEDQIWAKQVIEAGWKKAYSNEGAVYHSHDYRILEKLQRSFDESLAFRRLFGYVLGPSLKHAVLSTLACTQRDLAYARSERLWVSNFKAVMQMPFINLMTAFGHYLGSRGDTMSPGLRRRLSRDRRVSEGLPTSSSGGAR